MKALSRINERARSAKRRVVLPEGTEPRVIQAVKKILSEGIGSVTLIGDEDQIAKLASEHGVNLSRVEVVRHDKADASVAGSINTSCDVLRAAIQVLGLKEGISAVSSCFMMTVPKYRDQLDKVFLYADGAVLPNPTAEQLVSVAAATADTMKNLLGEEPRVAFLSFSTKGSARQADVDKVVTAYELFKKSFPDIKADGELQVDAAIVPEVADSKAPGSAVGGDANILIFTDLDAGNIAYKLTQRLAGATATGPIIQGLAKSAIDLSRGCTADDIVDVAAIAMLMKG